MSLSVLTMMHLSPLETLTNLLHSARTSKQDVQQGTQQLDTISDLDLFWISKISDCHSLHFFGYSVIIVWRGGRGSAKSAAGERLRRQR